VRFPHRTVGTSLAYTPTPAGRDGTTLTADMETPFGWLRVLDSKAGLTRTEYDPERPPPVAMRPKAKYRYR
jgi:hypothetical protein